MKKLAIITIGIPGSGKTTAMQPLAARYGLERVSRDDIRDQLFGHPFDRSDQTKVLAEANRKMSIALAKGISVILDSTFVERSKRKEIVQAARNAGADKVIGIIFSIPLSTAKARNQSRKHVVKEEILDSKYAQLASEPPEISDGFDALYTSKELDKVEEQELKGRG